MSRLGVMAAIAAMVAPPPLEREFGGENPLGWPYFEQLGIRARERWPRDRNPEHALLAIDRAKAKRARKAAERRAVVGYMDSGQYTSLLDCEIGMPRRKLASARKRRWWTR